MRILKNKKFMLVAMLFAVVIIIANGFVLYYRSLKNDLSDSAFVTLTELIEQQKFNFVTEMASDIQSIKNLAVATGLFDRDISWDLEMYDEFIKNTNFEFLTMCDLNGKGYVNNGETVDVSKRAYYHKSLEGETVINEPMASVLRKAVVITISTPVYSDGEIIGVLIGSYARETLNKVLLPSYNGRGYAYVIADDGTIVASTQNDYVLSESDNFFKSFESAKFLKFDSLETIRANIASGGSGHVSYAIGSNRRLAHYAPVGVNGWYIFVIVPDEVISANAYDIMRKAVVLSAVIMMSFGLFILFILWQQRQAEKTQLAHTAQLERIAFLDELTEAPTLTKFKLDSQRLLEENQDEPYVLVKFDIDRFKLINQTYGYVEGDRVLRNVATALKGCIDSEQDTFARVNTDEFTILHRIKPTERLADLRDAFMKSFFELMGDVPYGITFPQGSYIVEQRETNKDILDAIEKANIAHRKAKHDGVEYCSYDDAMKRDAMRDKEIENKMRPALKNGEFKVFLQPKYYIVDETIAGAEALVRWKNNNADVYYPGSFIPLFERNGFITKLDMYMFEHVCEIIRGWIADGIEPITVSVNFSRNHLHNPDFVSELCAIADKYGVSRRFLEIELTETVMFDNEEKIMEVLNSLHGEGFTLSMDDFGTGYSSLGLLKNIPVDVIKIDRGFFLTAVDPDRANTVISNVMKMAHELGIHTVAEGVEAREQIDMLRDVGCEIVQGYYYAKPMPDYELTKQLKEAKRN